MRRESFAKVKDGLPLPDLIESQLNSFDQFVQKGIDEVFSAVFPISDHHGTLELRYVSSKMEKPKLTPDEAKTKDMTYSAPLRAQFELVNKEINDTQPAEIFMGDFPFMTEKGAFVYNGVERVVVTQIVRSPGIYYDGKIDDKGRHSYTAKIIPSRGAWVVFELDSKGLWVKVDSSKKIPATVFLKAIGLGDNDALMEMFDNNPAIAMTLEKDSTQTEDEALVDFYRRIRPNDPPVHERAKAHVDALFFDVKKYDLAEVGRYKLNKKLALKERALKKTLARETSFAAAGTVINDDMIDESGIRELWVETKDGRPVRVVGNEQVQERNLTREDFRAAVNYLLTINEGIGAIDNIDHLGNRRLRLVGELLQNQFQSGMMRVEKIIREKLNVSQSSMLNNDVLTVQSLIHIRPLVALMREFLGSGQLSQFVDQINPLAEITNKRRVSALGPGGIQKDRASVDVRDVHHSHYGKICPIETPEGFGVGLIGSQALYSRVNKYGFLETPYRRLSNGKLTGEIDYLTADDEDIYYIAQASELDENGEIEFPEVTVRYGHEYPRVTASQIDYVDVSTKQIVSIGAALIPFLEHDDANRAVMGANMQRQAVPLVAPEEPLIGTGIESKVARDTQSAYVAEGDGIVSEVTPRSVTVQYDSGQAKTYKLNKFVRSNNNTCFHHYARAVKGQRVAEGDVLADGTSARNGELAIGRNCLVAFMPWKGYNYEDAILLNERLVKEDAFTTITITEHTTEIRETRIGREEITTDIPHTSQKQRENLDEDGIVKVGTKVGGNDILVGKITPKSQEEVSASEKLLHVIFNDKMREHRDTSLRMPNGKEGVVIDVVRLNSKAGADLQNGVIERIKVYVAQRRKIVPGDKMAGRHGNKGVVSKILPEADMPHLPDGTPVDIVLNPLGVPSRMNIGQIMEAHLGMVAKTLGIKFETPVFDGATPEEIEQKLVEVGLPKTGKFKLIDGKTGEFFENEVTVGVMYVLKLNHQVYDKLHARSTGPYSLVTQQPLGGKAQMGGQRFGEMEVWALEAHGAAFTLQELLTVKSDDVVGRGDLYKALVKGADFPAPSVTESFRVLINEIRGLGLDIDAITKQEKSIFQTQKKAVVEIEDAPEEDEENLFFE